MERVLWSVVLVLVWVASLTVLTWQEFTVAALVPVAVVATKARRAITSGSCEVSLCCWHCPKWPIALWLWLQR